MSNIIKGLLLMLITLVMIWIMNKSGSLLKTTTTPNGILNLELAVNKNGTNVIVQQWDQLQLTAAAKKNTYYDFVFLISYTALFYFLCRQTAKQFRISSFPSKVSSLFSYAALLAGIMDVFENFGMLLSLYGHSSKSVTLLTFISSLIKWGIVAGCVSWLLIVAVILLFRMFSGKNKIDSAFAK